MKKIKKIISGILSLINRLIAKKRMISFASFPDYSDNSKALYEYMVFKKVFDDYEYVWHVDKPENFYKTIKCKVLKKGSLSSIICYMQSKYIFSTHGIYDTIKATNGQTRVLLWHGMPLKKIGYLNEADTEKGVQIANYYCVTSECFKSIFIKAFKAAEDNIVVTGQPRNDELFITESKSLKHFKDFIGNNYILYLPTYRKTAYRNEVDGRNLNSNSYFFGGKVKDWIQLDRILNNESMKMVIKPHPMEANEFKRIEGLKNIIIITDSDISEYGLSLNRIMSGASALITDYSSAYIDYLLLDRPIFFFVPDIEEYKQSRGFIFEKIESYLPGPIYTDFSELKNNLFVEDIYEKERKKINNLFNDVKGPEACENILKLVYYIDNKMKGMVQK